MTQLGINIKEKIKDEPQQWVANEEYFVHKPTKLTLFIKGGFLFLYVVGDPAGLLSMKDKWDIYQEYKYWAKNYYKGKLSLSSYKLNAILAG